MNKKMISLTKETNAGEETFILKKRTDKEEVTKTLEKISNGWLLKVDRFPLNGEGEYTCVKKYFEMNPLDTEEANEAEQEDGMQGTEFQENWDVLTL